MAVTINTTTLETTGTDYEYRFDSGTNRPIRVYIKGYTAGTNPADGIKFTFKGKSGCGNELDAAGDPILDTQLYDLYEFDDSSTTWNLCERSVALDAATARVFTLTIPSKGYIGTITVTFMNGASPLDPGTDDIGELTLEVV